MRLLDDPKPDGDPDALITVASPPTSFEAGAIVIQLEQEGIPACAFATADLGVALNHATGGVPVQVRRADHGRARDLLEQGNLQTVPAPSETKRHVPMAANVARAVAIMIALLTLAGLIAVLVT